MVVGEAVQEHQREMEREPEREVFEGADGSDDGSDDPSLEIVEQTRSVLSKISINRQRARKREDDDAILGIEPQIESAGIEIPVLDEKDAKAFEKVEELIKGGDLEKLKVDQCKIYLRKYGLRLNGKKGILISRIKEHQEIIDGCGERKYPPESFVMNCKGDACLGDVVIFEQNVYEMFSIVSRSATGPSCGTRTVAGRIVKESYGAAKQQHTFTIEVLWSKGVKPWPPLHPLLIKGRNLYRIKTMRQRWTDEGERRKVLQDKHARGFCARSSRDVRMQEKERRKNGMIIKRNNLPSKSAAADKENLRPQTTQMRSNSTSFASIQQISDVSIPQQPQAQRRVPEYDYRTHVGTLQAPNWQNFGNNLPAKSAAADKENLLPQTAQMQSNSTSFASIQQISDVSIPQQPQAQRVPEYDYRTHGGTLQAPNWQNFGYTKQIVRDPHNHHHAKTHESQHAKTHGSNNHHGRTHGSQQSMESRNYVSKPHDHQHNYNANHYLLHRHQASTANQFIHPVQNPRFQKKQ